MSHAGSYAQGSSVLPGLTEDGEYDIQTVDIGFPSITLAVTPPNAQGQVFAWGGTLSGVYRVALGQEFRVVARMSTDEGSLQDFFAGAYTLLDDEGVFFMTTATGIHAYRAVNPDDIDSPIERVAKVTLGQGEDTVRGLSLTWDGHLVVATSQGRVIALTRQLETVDEVSLPGEVSNSIATDSDGGVYVVTSTELQRIQWTGTSLSTADADGAWSAAYPTREDVPGGRLGAGSGSTPSLMDVGDDRLVIITDGQQLMHLVAFWRDRIPEDAQAIPGADVRVAAIHPVTFGDPNRTSSTSEQSVLVMGDGAVVVSNDYGDASGLTPIIDGISPKGIERFTWNPRRRTLESTWTRQDLSCPNGIPAASSATRTMFCVGRRGETWTIEALAWDSGESVLHVPLGESSSYNSSYAATEIGPDQTILSGTLTGAVQIRSR